MSLTIAVKTSRFGELQVEESGVITIKGGLLGFSGRERYALLTPDAQSPFRWLQSLDDPELAFVLIDPLLVDGSYRVAIDPQTMETLEIDDLSKCFVFAIVTLTEDPSNVTANLLGPVVINPDNGSAIQLVLSDTKYTARHKLLN